MAWNPDPDDEAALGEILAPVGRTAVSVLMAPAGAEGLSLRAAGRTLLLLPDTSEDVQLEVRVDLSGCDGTLALGARVAGDSTGGFFRVRSDGSTRLVARRAGEEEILDQADSSPSWGEHAGSEQTLGLAAVGRHWKGFVDGATAVHGHDQLPASGRTALLVDGAGTIRLLSVRISPVRAGKVDDRAHGESHPRDRGIRQNGGSAGSG